MHEWLRAFVLAVCVLLLVHLFVFRWVTVQSTSMYATLLPGDLVLVQRWPVWTGMERGDIVVFRDPLKDHLPKWKRPLVVKRIAGMPGDTVELRRAGLYVNGQRIPDPPLATRAYLVRLRTDHGPEEVLKLTHLPSSLLQPGRRVLELPLNRTMADSLEQLASVVLAEEMSLASGAPRHIFPFSERFRWNGDNYGPIKVPARGDTLVINVDNLPLYDRLMSRYEGRTLTVDRNTLLLEGEPLERYVVRQDHYFVLGDSRHHSADSRYWGFLPGDHMVGRASVVVTGKGLDGLRSGRRWLRD
jgi:signal peptidase I